jgi:integrase
MIDEWLKSLRSKSTKNVYLSSLKNFVRVVIGDYDNLDQTMQNYLKQKKNPYEDLLTYATSLRDSPPKTANAYVQAVINFLEFSSDFELSKKQRKQLRNAQPRGSRARTIEEDLTIQRLRNILTHCDSKGKALFLFLESSGIRVGEALQLELDDIQNLDLKNEPVKVNVRGEYTKTGDPYFSFISQEARESLIEWLKVRDDYLASSAQRGRGLAQFKEDGRGVKPIKDKRIFPFSFSVAQSMWNNALKKAVLENHDKGTHRRTIHIHMLRKIFLSQLKLVIPPEIADALAGHEEGLSSAYRRYSEAQIKEWYLKGEPHLYVFVPQEISQIQTHFNTELQDLKEKMSNLLYDNQRLMVDRDEQRKRVEELSKTMNSLQSLMEGKIEAITVKLIEKRMEEIIKEHYEIQSKTESEQ